MGSFTEGIGAGIALRQARPNRKALEEQARLARQKQAAELFQANLDEGKNQTVEAVKAITQGVTLALQNGAAPDDPRIVSAAQQIQDLLQMQTRIEESVIDAALVEGFPVDAAMAAFGEPGDFERNQMSQVMGALSLAGLNTPEFVGAAEGRGDLAEAEAILDRPLTDAERQRRANVAPPSALVNINQGQETAFRKKIGTEEATLLIDIEQKGASAREQLVEIDRIKSALKSGTFTTGFAADSRVWLARLFEFFDVAPPENIIGNAATADTLDAAAARLGIEAATEMSRITNLTLEFIKSSLPQLTRTVEGNKILADVLERMAKRKIELARRAEDFKREGTLTPEGKQSWNEMLDELNETDPVIDDKLRKRIEEGAKGAPRSFSLFKDFRFPFAGSESFPEGIPTGSIELGTKDGVRYFRTSDGELLKWVPNQTTE